MDRTSNVSLVARLFRNEEMSLLKSMKIYDKPDKPLLSGQPRLHGPLLVPREWPLSGGSGLRHETCMKHTFFVNGNVNPLHAN